MQGIIDQNLMQVGKASLVTFVNLGGSFGLKSLDELPPLAEIRDLAEIDPQLPLDAPLRVQALVAALQESGPVDDDAAADSDVVMTPAPTTDENDDQASAPDATNA